jgi:hypothetical protein
MPDVGLLPITRRRAWLILFLGPASSWDNPLRGTRYDPIIRDRRDLERSIARRFRREQKHHSDGAAVNDFSHDGE